MAADAWARGVRLQPGDRLMLTPVTHDPARRLALDVLRAVRERGAYANLLLPQLMRERRLPARDRAFATELTYGALRAQGSLDLSLDRFIKRKVDPPYATRFGSAPISSGAPGCRRAPPSPRRSIWCAPCLRAPPASPTPSCAGWPRIPSRPRRRSEADPRGHLAVVHSHPRWIVDAFAAALGDPAPDELAAALAADDARPPVHLVARTMSRDDLLAEAGAGSEPGAVVAARRLPAGRRSGRARRRQERRRRRAGRGQPAGRACPGGRRCPGAGDDRPGGRSGWEGGAARRARHGRDRAGAAPAPAPSWWPARA